MLLENVLYLIETASVERFLAKTEGHPPRNLLERVESSSQRESYCFVLISSVHALKRRADCCLVSRSMLILGTLVGSLSEGWGQGLSLLAKKVPVTWLIKAAFKNKNRMGK